MHSSSSAARLASSRLVSTRHAASRCHDTPRVAGMSRAELLSTQLTFVFAVWEINRAFIYESLTDALTESFSDLLDRTTRTWAAPHDLSSLQYINSAAQL